VETYQKQWNNLKLRRWREDSKSESNILKSKTALTSH
jgi:hypothetical protein